MTSGFIATTNLFGELCEVESRQWSLFCRLQHQGVARREARSQLDDSARRREVPLQTSWWVLISKPQSKILCVFRMER